MVLVRRAEAHEAAAIASVLRRAFADYEPLYTPAAFAATVPAADSIRARWDEGPVWIARRDGAVVGTVAAVVKDSGVYMRSMAIVPEARGLGVAGALLDEVDAFARGRGARRVFLSTTPFLHDAIRLYERYGFRRSAEGPTALHGTPLFTMERILTS